MIKKNLFCFLVALFLFSGSINLGAVVLEQVNTNSPQTITNKTLNAPTTLNSPAITSPTITGTSSITGTTTIGIGATLSSPTLDDPVLTRDIEASLPASATEAKIIWLDDGPQGLIGDFGTKLAHMFGYNWIASAYTDCNAAITAIGATQATLVVQKNCVISATATAPSTLSWRFEGQGVLSPAAGTVLTINGTWNAPKRKIINCVGAELCLVFGAGTINGAYPEWFGALGDGTTDDLISVRATFSSTNKIVFSKKTYLLKGSVSKNVDNVEVDLGGATINFDAPSTGFFFGVTSDTPVRNGLSFYGGTIKNGTPTAVENRQFIQIKGTKRVKIHDLRLINVSNGGIYIEAGTEDIEVYRISIEGGSSYTTLRGIWLNGSTASDYAGQLIDTSSITRNATALPLFAAVDVSIHDVRILIPGGYGIYLINARDTTIDNAYIDISNSGARCIAVNNYSPRTKITRSTFIGNQTSTGILVTQFSHDVIIEGNFFKGTFGGGRDIYVAYLGSALIRGNDFFTNSTQQILIDMGGTAVIDSNYFSRDAYAANTRAVKITTIDEAVAGTGDFGDTATVLAGSIFRNNVVHKRVVPMTIVSSASTIGTIPGLDTIVSYGNVFYDFDTAVASDEFGMRIATSAPTNKIKYSYSNNFVYPEASAKRNTVSVTGIGTVDVESQIRFASFHVSVLAAGGAITVTKTFGANFSLSVSRSGSSLVLSPRTIGGAAGASVATVAGILDFDASSASHEIARSGSNYLLELFDTAGALLNTATAATEFDIIVVGSGT